MTTSTLDRFVAAIELADTLPDPAAIYRAILAGSRDVDDGLRSTGAGSGRVSGGTSSSHPERVLAQRHPGQFPDDKEPDWEDQPGAWGGRIDRSRDDLLALRRATDRVLDAVSALNAECCDAGTVEDWDAALKDAHLLASQGYITAALDVGRHIDHWLIRFAHAVDTVRAIRDSWMAHRAPEGLAEENQPWCRSCLRIELSNGDRLRRTRHTKMCCQRCFRDIQDLEGYVLDDQGHPIPAVELQMSPAYWPSEAMTKAREDGRTVLLEKERTKWLRSHGADVSEVHRRRQERRSA